MKNLQAVIVDAGVKLTWTIHSSDEGAAGFKVYRSKDQPEKNECPGCTRDFEVVTTITVKADDTRFEVIDPYVRGKGRLYYKVTPFDKEDRPGPDSNESMVVIE